MSCLGSIFTGLENSNLLDGRVPHCGLLCKIVSSLVILFVGTKVTILLELLKLEVLSSKSYLLISAV